MWPLLEHPGPNPTSKPLLPGHQLVFPLQAQICLPAPQILPQKSQRLGLPTETDPRLSTGEVWHWIPNKTLQESQSTFRQAWVLGAWSGCAACGWPGPFPQCSPSRDQIWMHIPSVFSAYPAASSLPTTSRGKISPSWHKCDNLQAPAV